MKKLFFLLILALGLFSVEATAQSCHGKKAKAEKTAAASAEAAAVLASLDPNIQTRTCAVSGTVSYVEKTTCPVSGTVSFVSLEYDAENQAFRRVEQVSGESAPDRAAEPGAEAPAKKSCTKSKAECKKKAKAKAKV